jgi:capsular polysaccharide biosynthesis protein
LTPNPASGTFDDPADPPPGATLSYVEPTSALSPVRRFYRQYLDRFAVIRRVKAITLGAVFGVRSAFYSHYYRVAPRLPVWCSPTNIRRLRFQYLGTELGLISMGEFRKERPCRTIQIAPVTKVTIPGPRFVRQHPPFGYTPRHVKLESPGIEAIELRDATVIGASNFVVQDDVAVYPDYFEPERDVCMSERFGATALYPRSSRIRHILGHPIQVDAAVSMVGSCTGNYAHWLTETLPKLLAVDLIDEYRSLPLLVDDWIHQHHFDSIDIFNRHRRQIVRVPVHRPVRARRLIEISPPSFAPPEYRSVIERGAFEDVPYNVFKFSRAALNLVRRAAHDLPQRSSSPLRIFVQRKFSKFGNGRSVVNIHKIERVARRLGFVAVEPGSLSVRQQIDIFRRATTIVAPIGAALANAIFVKPGCKIIALAPYYEKANYYYFSNLLGILGHDLRYVLGPQVMTGPSIHPHHRDFRVDMDAFYEALRDMK